MNKDIFSACIEVVRQIGKPFQENTGRGRKNIYDPSIIGAILIYRKTFALDLRTACDDAQLFTEGPVPVFTNIAYMSKKVPDSYIQKGVSLLQNRFADILANFPKEPNKQENDPLAFRQVEKQKRQRLTLDKVKEYLEQGKTVIQIAKMYGVTRQAVYHHINRIKEKQKQDVYLPRHSKNSKKTPRNYNGSINWKEYNNALVRRGEAIARISSQFSSQWEMEVRDMNKGKRGRPYKYAESMILFLMKIKFLFHQDYRSLKGMSKALFSLFIPNIPDYSTICKRFKKMNVELKVYHKEKQSPQDVAMDTTGLKGTIGGQYRERKYERKRSRFPKLHTSVNIQTKQVIGALLTTDEVSDCKGLPYLLTQSQEHGKIRSVYLDRAYDSADNYFMFHEQQINSVIRPRKTMSLDKVQLQVERLKVKLIREKNEKKRKSLKGKLLRCETLKEYLQNEEEWKRKNNYGVRWVIEERYSVFKRKFSEHLFSRKQETKDKEVIIKLSLMNFFEDLVQGSRRCKN